MWIHRTRRFWVGIAVLLILLAAWILSIGELKMLGVNHIDTFPSGARYREVAIGIDDAFLVLAISDSTYSGLWSSSMKPGWDWNLNSYRYLFGDPGLRQIRIHLAAVLGFWTVIWVGWMILAERRELKRYASRDAPPAP
ncbi:MAG: hypothetical protein AAGB14_15370 [Verrucomicrobiota bacterium]